MNMHRVNGDLHVHVSDRSQKIAGAEMTGLRQPCRLHFRGLQSTSPRSVLTFGPLATSEHPHFNPSEERSANDFACNNAGTISGLSGFILPFILKFHSGNSGLYTIELVENPSNSVAAALQSLSVSFCAAAKSCRRSFAE